ncbi:MAG: type III-A CRISPR-associated protein Cas10/Csm1 [Campylobacteraceae bacterium]|jgi:CRISPR-associated protein Csm1|nr:type III-A CRISPR-associated protein Cas10/Csm1 [Campylobacteraceae bacterium]
MINKINQVALEALKKPFEEARTTNGIKPLKHLFANSQYFKTEPLSVEAIFPVEDVGENTQKCFDELSDIDKYDDIFVVDYFLRKNLSLVAYENISLYELCKKEAIFASVEYALKNGTNITDDEKPLLIISGDFFGIQRFIFENTPTDKAAKTLRAKSAYVQLLTKIIAFYIVERLGLSYLSIISTNAGKFEILGVNTAEAIVIIKEIQNELNDHFIKDFFGETGIGISVTPCSFADFERDRYRSNLRERIKCDVEESKFKKFNLLETNPILDYDDDINNTTLCSYCGKRKKKEGEECEICEQFIKIGEQLTKDGFLVITKIKDGVNIFGDYFVLFNEDVSKFKEAIAIYDIKSDDFRGYAKWEIASYVRYENNTVMDFDKLAEQSCGGKSEDGIKALIALKGDVDGMGDFVKNSEATADFMSFNFFSRMVDYFFSVYSPYLMCEKYQNLYTVFAGGDDLFVFGAWGEVIEFAKNLRQDFIRFADGKLTFSTGMVLSKANKSVSFVAHIAEEELKNAKNIDEKNAIALFGECVKWDEYIKIRRELISSLEKFEEKTDLASNAFLYRVLELIDMKKKLKDNIEPNALWKSKLNYTFKRNIYDSLNNNDEEKNLLADDLLDKLYQMVENHPEETRMVLIEYIYKRRKQQ